MPVAEQTLHGNIKNKRDSISLHRSFIMYIDFAAAAILIICILVGEKRGFLKSFLSAFGWIFSLVVTLLYSPRLADYLTEHTELKTSFSNLMIKHFKSLMTDAASSSGSSQDIPDLVAHYIASNADSVLERTVRPLADNLADTFISIIAFFVMIFVVKFVIHFVERLLTSFRKNDTVGTVDGIFGMLFGIVKGSILVYLLICLLLLVAVFTSSAQLTEVIQDSVCINALDSHGLFFFDSDIINGITLPETDA